MKPSDVGGFPVAQMTETVLTDAAQVNFPFVEAIATTLKERPDANYYNTNGFTKGISIVLRGYDLEAENKLMEGMANLDQDDIAEMQTLIRHGDKMAQHDVPIIERVLAQPRIPEQQVNLRQTVNAAAERVDRIEADHLKMGAAIMYKVLSKNWGKLMAQ